jgi:anti-sigma regulatory factor (Ser/Thr protein kinase)
MLVSLRQRVHQVQVGPAVGEGHDSIRRDGRTAIAANFGTTARTHAPHSSPPARFGRLSQRAQSSVQDGLTLRLPGDRDAAAKARRALGNLRGDLDPPLMETLRLLVTELVTNSVRHTGAETIVLRILVGRSAVWTEVTDAGPGFDPPGPVRASNDGAGWGLFLVERLAERWGVNQSDAGTKVWFELRRA